MEMAVKLLYLLILKGARISPARVLAFQGHRLHFLRHRAREPLAQLCPNGDTHDHRSTVVRAGLADSPRVAGKRSLRSRRRNRIGLTVRTGSIALAPVAILAAHDGCRGRIEVESFRERRLPDGRTEVMHALRAPGRYATRGNGRRRKRRKEEKRNIVASCRDGDRVRRGCYLPRAVAHRHTQGESATLRARVTYRRRRGIGTAEPRKCA